MGRAGTDRRDSQRGAELRWAPCTAGSPGVTAVRCIPGDCILSIKPHEKSEGLQLNFQQVSGEVGWGAHTRFASVRGVRTAECLTSPSPERSHDGGGPGAGLLLSRTWCCSPHQNVNDTMMVLPKLSTGLDVNVRFTGVSDFEYTPECIVFDLLNVPLYHGWLVDPQVGAGGSGGPEGRRGGAEPRGWGRDVVDPPRCDFSHPHRFLPFHPLQSPEVVRAVGKLSYNQLVEKIITCKHSGDPNLVTEGGSRAGGAQGRPGPALTFPPPPPGLIAEQFLESTASQLTYHGLCELTAAVKEEELSVFFRNNHFSTMIKHKVWP